MSADDDIRRAAHAQIIMEDELVKEAFEEIERDLVNQWMTAQEDDVDGRERCYRTVLGLRVFKGYFEAILANGKFAQHEQTGAEKQE